jgi:hypothetical protein
VRLATQERLGELLGLLVLGLPRQRRLFRVDVDADVDQRGPVVGPSWANRGGLGRDRRRDVLPWLRF